MSHVGARSAELVDGEAGDTDRERALAHLAVCGECRREVDALRRIKTRIATLPNPEPPSDLKRRLKNIEAAGPPVPPRSRIMPGVYRPGPVAAPGRERPLTRPIGHLHRWRRSALVGFAATGVLLTTAFIVGGQPRQPVEKLPPAVGTLTSEHAATAGDFPLSDPAWGVTVDASLRRLSVISGDASSSGAR
jgi:anti-sigma factor RsiW